MRTLFSRTTPKGFLRVLQNQDGSLAASLGKSEADKAPHTIELKIEPLPLEPAEPFASTDNVMVATLGARPGTLINLFGSEVVTLINSGGLPELPDLTVVKVDPCWPIWLFGVRGFLEDDDQGRLRFYAGPYPSETDNLSAYQAIAANPARSSGETTAAELIAPKLRAAGHVLPSFARPTSQPAA